MRRLLMAAVLATPWMLGCWASTTRVEQVGDAHVRFDLGPPQAPLRSSSVSFREDEQGLTLILVRQEMCGVSEVRASRDRVHTKTEASNRRWIPAGVLAGAGIALLVNDRLKDEPDGAGSSLVLLGIAAAIVAIPELSEREHTRLGELHYRSVPAPERPCGQSTVSNARVVLRTSLGTLDGRTGEDGSVRFDGLRRQQVRTVFVDDVTVWP
jgi:hypothetical protein